MNRYAKANRKWWNTITPIHSNSKLYDLEGFKKGKSHLDEIELNELGSSVKGKTLLHLMCHFGMGTLSWARLGAKATGVDLSDDSIKLAKKLSQELDIPAAFICSDIYDLPKVLHKKFDIVFMSYGVLLWLPDIKKLAKIVNRFLKIGGTFYIVDTHPFTTMLDSNLQIHYKYFKKGPYRDDSSGTYTDWSTNVKGVTYDWSHTIGDVINALTKQGLKIEYVHEFPFTTYDQFPGCMEQDKKGHYVLKNKKIEIPLLFSLKATK